MKAKTFLVEQPAKPRTEMTNIAAIVAGVEDIHPTKNAYYVVNKPNRDYLQFAGSRERLVAETRSYSGDAFTHCVIGYDTEPGYVDKVECTVGPIRVNQNQVLTVADAKRLIEAFCRDQPWPADYKLTDVTEAFL